LIVGKSSLGGRYEGYKDSVLRVPLVMNPNHLFFQDVDWREMPAFAHLDGHYQKSFAFNGNGKHLTNQQKIDQIPI